MMAFLSIIPIIGPIIEGISKAWFDAKVRLTAIRLGVDRDKAIGILQTAAQENHDRVQALSVFASNKMLTCLLLAFATPLVITIWKVYIWDAMLGWGSTDPVKGQIADWGNTIIWFLFGSPTAMGIAKMWFGRKQPED